MTAELEKLKELELYGKGLILVESKERVGRYNSALQLIGLEPTTLKEFFIDGWGWSPEIALEKEDNFYLSHGLANPYAVIITPDQTNVPVYMPYHSFDNEMIQSVFSTFSRQIHDLTTQTAIVIECDQEISTYRSPQDLLGIEYFTLRFSTTDNLSEAKEVQMKLERKFFDEEHAWLDKALRAGLRESYRRFGVLADKKFLLPDHKFMEVDSFYTKAFDGLFLFRNESKLAQTLLIREVVSEDEKTISGQASNHVEYYLHDLKLTEYLIVNGMIGVYPQKVFEQIEDLERHLFCILAEIIYEKEPLTEVTELSNGQLKKRINEYAQSGDLPDYYFELESIISQVKKGTLIDSNKLSSKVYKMLMRPNPELGPNKQWLLWRVILKMNPFDLFRLYIYDKEEFYQRYQRWPAPKQNWALHYITPRYISTKQLNLSTS